MNSIINEILANKKFTDTRIGTDSLREFSNGNTLPLLGTPHGLNYFAVQTDGRTSWFFNPNEREFQGFRLTHQPSPWMEDFSYMTILPFSKDLDTEYQKVYYDTKKSTFRPIVNKIIYESGEEAIITADEEAAIINFKADSEVSFKITGLGIDFIKKDEKIVGKVINYSGCEDEDFTMYVTIGLDCNFELENIEGYFYIKTKAKEANLKLATSFISEDQATYNYEKACDEISDMLASAANKWQEYLDIFDVELTRKPSQYDQYEVYDRKDQVSMFYHCVYRSFLFPTKFYEIDRDGNEVHYNTLAKEVRSGKLYTNIGFWDGQKTLFPLLSLVATKDYEDILEGVYNSYKETGFLPKWLSPDERGLMPGTLVDSVIADAITKDIGSDLADDLLKAMIDSSEKESDDPHYGRYGAYEFRENGYISSDKDESVNQTLDNCLSDFSIGVAAKKLGYDDLAEKYLNYSHNWTNLFDPDTKFLVEKDKDGKFKENFDPYDWGSPYTEGGAYQNSYNMYHDFDKLIELFGSKGAFKERLDELVNADSNYNIGHYDCVIHEMLEVETAHFGQVGISNQPSFHLPYLYHFVDRPDLSQYLVKNLLLNYFRYDFKGYPGDEDNGSMSAWYILSALGIYPVCPGTNEYMLGIGLFDKVSIKLANGNTLKILVEENYHHKKFVDTIKIDGKVIDERKISHEDFINAKEIVYRLNIIGK